MKVTMPHERALDATRQLLDDCIEVKQSVVILVDNYEDVHFVISDIKKALDEEEFLNKNNPYRRTAEIKLYREGVAFSNGSIISVRLINNPAMLHGLYADKVILAGRLGDLFGFLSTLIKNDYSRIEAWF